MATTIGVFYHEVNPRTPWVMLRATGDYLTENGWLPNVGDRIAVKAADHGLIVDLPMTTIVTEEGEISKKRNNEMPEDFQKTVVTVKERIYNYSLSDIALVCVYEPF